MTEGLNGFMILQLKSAIKFRKRNAYGLTLKIEIVDKGNDMECFVSVISKCKNS